MKKLIIFASTLTVLAGAASCQKNIEQSQPQLQPSGEYRQVTITAGAAGSKTSVSGGTLTWSENDILNIVPQSGSIAAAALEIKSGVGESSGTFEGQIDASITDATQLYGWCGGSWTYNEGAFTVDMPATQTYVENGLAENAYPSIGTGSIKDGLSLSNPMGVLKLTVKGAISDTVKTVAVTSGTKNLAGSFSINKIGYAVSGGSSNIVTLNLASSDVALSATGATFYIVLPPAEYAANDLSVKVTFRNDEYLNVTLTNAVTVTAGNATAQEVSDSTGRRGTLRGQDWVMIMAQYDGTNDSYLKWATENLAVTASGQAKWRTTNYQIGDYFQWAASYSGYGITTEADKIPTNLVIYNSFTTTCTGGAKNKFSFKDDKTSGFVIGNAPYYSGSSYTKYTTPATLEQSDDVANIVLGCTWRMPTGGSAGEIKAMRAVTYWAWDDTDKGYYVFKPGLGTSGAANESGNISGTDDKTKALLFFPAAGEGYTTKLRISNDDDNNYWGRIWSSTLRPDDVLGAYHMYTNPNSVYPDSIYYRYYGFSVRPVSD